MAERLWVIESWVKFGYSKDGLNMKRDAVFRELRAVFVSCERFGIRGVAYDVKWARLFPNYISWIINYMKINLIKLPDVINV